MGSRAAALLGAMHQHGTQLECSLTPAPRWIYSTSRCPPETAEERQGSDVSEGEYQAALLKS